MWFKEPLEYKFSVIEQNVIRRIRLLKFQHKLGYGKKNILQEVVLYFFFNRVIDVDSILIHRNLLLLWLCYGSIGRILYFKNRLYLGKRYFSFSICNKIKKLNLDQCISFSFEFLYPQLVFKMKDILKFIYNPIDINSVLILCKELSFFTGLSLYPGIFFMRVLQPLYFRFFFCCEESDFLEVCLSYLKLSFWYEESKASK